MEVKVKSSIQSPLDLFVKTNLYTSLSKNIPEGFDITISGTGGSSMSGTYTLSILIAKL